MLFYIYVGALLGLAVWGVLDAYDGVDPEPFSEEEVAYAEAYAAMLTLGEPEPDDSQLEPERAQAIRAELDRRWRRNVRRISRRR